MMLYFARCLYHYWSLRVDVVAYVRRDGGMKNIPPQTIPSCSAALLLLCDLTLFLIWGVFLFCKSQGAFIAL